MATAPALAGQLWRFDPTASSQPVMDLTPYPGTPMCDSVGFTNQNQVFFGLGGQFTDNTCQLEIIDQWWQYQP